MEPNGRLTVWANAQAPFPVRQEVAKTLGLSLNNVRVISAGLGGGFGGKGSGITSGAAIEPICGLLAIKPLLSRSGVEFIGEINEAEKQEFLGRALALLFPVDWPEPFGLVMIEAL